jgi:uncharacterized membrane protein
MLLIKKIQNLRHDKVKIKYIQKMNIDDQKKSWYYFKKLTFYVSFSIIVILFILTLFLL